MLYVRGYRAFAYRNSNKRINQFSVTSSLVLAHSSEGLFYIVVQTENGPSEECNSEQRVTGVSIDQWNLSRRDCCKYQFQAKPAIPQLSVSFPSF